MRAKEVVSGIKKGGKVTARRRQDQNRQGGGGDYRGNTGKQAQQEMPHNNQVNHPRNHLEVRDRLNLAKGKRIQGAGNDEEPKKIKCFRCQEFVHHQKYCENAPICYKCKEEGHMAAECANFHSKVGELKMYGFAVQGQGFYSIKIHGEGET